MFQEMVQKIRSVGIVGIRGIYGYIECSSNIFLLVLLGLYPPLAALAGQALVRLSESRILFDERCKMSAYRASPGVEFNYNDTTVRRAKWEIER